MNQDCPRCGETNIHNKETRWECQDCDYSWPKDDSPSNNPADLEGDIGQIQALRAIKTAVENNYEFHINWTRVTLDKKKRLIIIEPNPVDTQEGSAPGNNNYNRPFKPSNSLKEQISREIYGLDLNLTDPIATQILNLVLDKVLGLPEMQDTTITIKDVYGDDRRNNIGAAEVEVVDIHNRVNSKLLLKLKEAINGLRK